MEFLSENKLVVALSQVRWLTTYSTCDGDGKKEDPYHATQPYYHRIAIIFAVITQHALFFYCVSISFLSLTLRPKYIDSFYLA